MFHQKNVYFILFLVYLSIGTIHTQLNKKESPKKRTEKRKDPQTVVVVREVKPVNGRYRDESEEVDDEFHEDMRSFHEGDVLDDVSKSGPERKREAQARSLGGLVINIDGLLSGAKFVPENVFGPKYKTHLIEEPCTPVGFPYICELREMIDRRYKCPVDIPYCQRIPCGGNPEFNTDQYKCLKQPGCCFDEVLYNYRRYYGQTVLPRVPVCHMAVRNQYFHRVARQFADRYRSWNPLLTSCLIKSHRNRIEKNLMECQTLDILEYFGYKAKHAGWNDILPRECGLIGGCWRPGFGCFYPPRMTHIQLRSSYEHPIYRPYSPFDLYGQPMCRPMDPYANSEDFLSSYHQCLASGCQLDPAVTPNVILYHLYNVSSQLPRHLVDSFKYEIMLGKVRPDNWKEQQKNFLKYGKIHPHAYTPRQGGPHAHANIPNEIVNLLGKFPGPAATMGPQRMSMQPRSFNVPLPQTPLQNPYMMLSAITGGQILPQTNAPAYPHLHSQFRNPNPNALIRSNTMIRPLPNIQPGGPMGSQRHFQQPFRPSYPGGSTRSGPSPRMNLYPMPCPYTVIRIPNFPALDGKVDGCCDRNLCYVGRETVRQQYSGAAAYWGPWGFWSRCSAPCGNAVQKRYRTCVGPQPISCAGPREDRRSCYNLPRCNEKTSKWTQWTSCDRSCGGYRVRTRKCLSSLCQGEMKERKACPTECARSREKKKDENKRKKN